MPSAFTAHLHICGPATVVPPTGVWLGGLRAGPVDPPSVGVVLGDGWGLAAAAADRVGDVAGDADGLPMARAAPGSATTTAMPAATPRASSLLLIRRSCPRRAAPRRSPWRCGGADPCSARRARRRRSAGQW